MKISAQEEYGLRCLLHLARSGHQSLTIPEIAAAERLSHPYVAKLLSVMRQAGLIESARGRTGGYRLAGAPVDISLGSVLRVLGEPLFEEPAYCRGSLRFDQRLREGWNGEHHRSGDLEAGLHAHPS